MAGDVSQLGLAGGPHQSFAIVSGTEEAPDNLNLLHASAQGISVHRQTRHRVFHRAILEAAKAYVAVLAVAFLILVCVRRVSNLSVAGGRVRSLAGAEEKEAAGACGGNGEGGGEEEKHGDGRAALIEQARKNIESFREVIMDLTELKSASAYRSSNAAVSTYILIIAEMGPLGIFIDRELVDLRPLWREMMHEAINSALTLETGWHFAKGSGGFPDIHMMNGDLTEYMDAMITAKKTRKARLSVDRLAALRGMLQVQPVTASIARACLRTINPKSDATRSARKQALGRLAAMADARRLMMLADKSFSNYFGSFFSRGFARQRFGLPCGRIARGANPPKNPEDQIKYLQEKFPEDSSVQSLETAAAVRPESPPDEASSATQMRPSVPPQGPPTHPQGPLAHPACPPSASGPGSQRPYSSKHLGARPKQAAASSGQKSSGPPSKQPSPEELMGKGISDASSLDTKPGKPPGGASGSLPQPPESSTLTWQVGPRFRRSQAVRRDVWAPNDVASSSTQKASSESLEEAEGGAQEGPQAPVAEIQEALVSLVVTEEEKSTADDGVEPEKGMQALDSSPFYAGQVTHGPRPQQGQAPAFPWPAPRAPIGRPVRGLMPPFSPRAGTFMGFAQGLPRPPSPSVRPALPPEPLGPPHSGKPPGHALHGPPGLPTFPGASAIPPSHWSSSPPGFAAPPQFSEAERHKRPIGPLGPLPPTSGGTDDGPPLGAAQHPFPRGPFPSSPSMPFPSGSLPPSTSEPAVGGPSHAAPAVPRMGFPPRAPPSVRSGLGPGPYNFAGPTLRPRFPPPGTFTPFPSGTSSLLPSQPSASGPLSLGLFDFAVSGLPADAPWDPAEPSSRISGVYHGLALGEPPPSSTSVSTAPPPS
ncbi:hypothetical protein ACSSS7_004690 [Eimeria intestinalis]